MCLYKLSKYYMFLLQCTVTDLVKLEGVMPTAVALGRVAVSTVFLAEEKTTAYSQGSTVN
jgi:hypothetical protein